MPDLKTFEEQKALTQQLNLMDDLFFQKVAEDRDACEGVTEMTSAFDIYADEKLKETAIQLLKNGASVELVTASFSSLSEETIQKLKEELELQTVV